MSSFQDLQQVIEAALSVNLPRYGHRRAVQLDSALRYAVFPGGKRLRPILTLLGARIFGFNLSLAMPAASAVEFIHTSSLIFDDLPCMDDAELRRGVPVLHRVFGEDVATLAALALLNQAYAIFGKNPALIAEATACIGVEGMIGGQALDVGFHDIPEETLSERTSHLLDRNQKTSAMMRLALTAGALACGASPQQVAPLGLAGQAFGRAFQICDDLLDVRRGSGETGKTSGQDGRHRRLSYSILEEHACMDEVRHLMQEAQRSLRDAYGTTQTAELMRYADALFATFNVEDKAAQ